MMEKRKKKYGDYEDYEIESAARTLMEAEEIKRDTKKMPHVQKCLKEKRKDNEKAIESIDDLRSRYKNMTEPKDSEY